MLLKLDIYIINMVGGWCRIACALPFPGVSLFLLYLNAAYVSSSAQAATPRQEEATPKNGMPPAFSNDSALVSNATGAKGDNGGAKDAAAKDTATEKMKDSSGKGIKAAPPPTSTPPAVKNAQKTGCCGCTIS